MVAKLHAALSTWKIHMKPEAHRGQQPDAPQMYKFVGSYSWCLFGLFTLGVGGCSFLLLIGMKMQNFYDSSLLCLISML